jgi:DNA modification methylase
VGTTTLVAHKIGRKYIGIDISQEYCITAEKRIADFDKQMILFRE